MLNYLQQQRPGHHSPTCWRGSSTSRLFNWVWYVTLRWLCSASKFDAHVIKDIALWPQHQQHLSLIISLSVLFCAIIHIAHVIAVILKCASQFLRWKFWTKSVFCHMGLKFWTGQQESVFCHPWSICFGRAACCHSSDISRGGVIRELVAQVQVVAREINLLHQVLQQASPQFHVFCF